MYEYNAFITRIVDGDTFEAIVDLGFEIKYKIRIRLKDIDTPETWRPKSEAEREHGEEATKFVKNLIENKNVIIKTYKQGIYNRYIADVFVNDRNLGTLLIEANLVKRNSYEA